MESGRSTQKPDARACRPQTAGSSEQGKEACSHTRLEQLLSGSTTGHNSFLLGTLVHEAVSQKDMDLLRCLVDCHKAPLNGENELHMTPLYRAVRLTWTTGALFLIKRGASISAAEESFYIWGSGSPLILLALKTGSKLLVKELVKRGVTIRVRDFYGDRRLDRYGFGSPDAVFRCLTDALDEKSDSSPDLLKDLLFVIGLGVRYQVKYELVEEFIKKHCGYYRRMMFQVFAACLSNRFKFDCNLVLKFWRKSANCAPRLFHDHSVEEVTAPKSVFADIPAVKQHPLPERADARDARLAIRIQALLAFEKHMPDDHHLVVAGRRLVDDLITEGELVTAILVSWRLTTIRALHSRETQIVKDGLHQALSRLHDAPEVPLVALLTSLKTIKNCLASLNRMLLQAKHTRSPVDKDFSGVIFGKFFSELLHTMIIFCDHELATAPDKLHLFTAHVKDCFQRFPRTDRALSFHLIANGAYRPVNALMIKILVTCSAEVFGTNRQNSPPHLRVAIDGGAPLHSMALFRSREDLVQEGVLQCFLDHGADLCTKNSAGETVRSILVKRKVFTEGELIPSLQCLAAAAFMRNRYLRQNVRYCRPRAVRNFLMDH